MILSQNLLSVRHIFSAAINFHVKRKFKNIHCTIENVIQSLAKIIHFNPLIEIIIKSILFSNETGKYTKHKGFYKRNNLLMENK